MIRVKRMIAFKRMLSIKRMLSLKRMIPIERMKAIKREIHFDRPSENLVVLERISIGMTLFSIRPSN
jgi:hypothetical protein